MTKPVLKIGFDLDGVVLYNPARMARPFISAYKQRFAKKTLNHFYYPKSKWEQWLWYLFHKTSLWPAPGVEDIRSLVTQGKVEAYLITGRYDHLKDDLEGWLKKISPTPFFKAIYHNQSNEQPQLYKQQKIKELDLDIFIEDNWDIVSHLLHAKNKGLIKTDVYWISNLIDWHYSYPHKFLNLKQALYKIKQLI